MSLLQHIKTPLIALLRSLIDYLQDLDYPGTPDISTIDLESQPPALSTATTCWCCTRPTITCSCSKQHCFYHKTGRCLPTPT